MAAAADSKCGGGVVDSGGDGTNASSSSTRETTPPCRKPIAFNDLIESIKLIGFPKDPACYERLDAYQAANPDQRFHCSYSGKPKVGWKEARLLNEYFGVGMPTYRFEYELPHGGITFEPGTCSTSHIPRTLKQLIYTTHGTNTDASRFARACAEIRMRCAMPPL